MKNWSTPSRCRSSRSRSRAAQRRSAPRPARVRIERLRARSSPRMSGRTAIRVAWRPGVPRVDPVHPFAASDGGGCQGRAVWCSGGILRQRTQSCKDCINGWPSRRPCVAPRPSRLAYHFSVGSGLLYLPAVVAIAGITLTASGGSLQTVPPAAYAREVQAWRNTHEADYRRDFVTIAGLHFLDVGTHTIGSGAANAIVLEASLPATIGTLTVQPDQVRF